MFLDLSKYLQNVAPLSFIIGQDTQQPLVLRYPSHQMSVGPVSGSQSKADGTLTSRALKGVLGNHKG